MSIEISNGKRCCYIVAAIVIALATTVVAEDTNWKYRFEPAEGITAAGQPNEEGLKELADDGYVAVIDLRTAAEDRGLEEQAVVEGLGMEYVSLPIAGRGAINFENADQLDRILARYDKPVLVHCGSSNRVGALLALREKMHGADDEGALSLGRSAGMTSLEVTVRERLAEE